MNTSDKTLLQILVEELPKRGGWPKFEREMQAVQDADGEIKFHFLGQTLAFERNNPGNWGSNNESAWLLWQVRETGDFVSNPNINCVTLASDYATAIITRDQYEAALAEKEHPLPWDEKNTDADGWIDWAGGECPVAHMQAVEVRYRDGTIKPVAPAFHYLWTNGYGDYKTTDADIVAYRLHQPQDANSRANDDRLAGDLVSVGLVEKPIDDACRVEADLNECIGQTPEDLEQLTRLLVEDIHYSAPETTIGSAYKIAVSLVDAGYRKQ